ncbi:TGF-beta-activated kinase 1 and MAP3K7-binding protein 1 isoform X2 [Aplysia californica]|uniref:TGF-beta-activated kinase 1 and MAP3K7-binding protein 1 isoform X2 n=1 Tax=Aplysia californica TaxID=6500 RepID=A0ABM0JIL2_APLCA|nr:TGF-beta-activated kinase 1 and MAP3K7-binding protein 1 isoform X2 [Aplysia californica]
MSNGHLSNGSSIPRFSMQDSALSWTDDLPVCHLSGVGLSTNQVYREDGNRREAHGCEDRNFHFSHDNCFLYGVFDGHNGTRVADFAAQRIPAELLLGQLQPNFGDHEVKEALRQAFIGVEKGYFESMDGLLAERTTCQDRLPEGIGQYEAYQKYPDVISKLQELEKEISGGTTATVVLIYNNKLYVANVGDTRAFLCKTGPDGVLRLIQLSYDHTIADPGEQARLHQAGVDINKLKILRRVGNSDCTRCIGDYHVKGGYKDIDILSSAKVEPVIADPFVDGGIDIDSSCAFLLVMSDGLYQALTDATGTETVNGDIAKMVAVEFSQQTTLTGVAQAVVDRVVRIHHDTFMTGTAEQKNLCKKRDDITLLVRNFNYALSVHSPSSIRTIHSPSQPPTHLVSHSSTGFPVGIYNSPSSNSTAESSQYRTSDSSATDSPKTPTNNLLAGPNLLAAIETNSTDVQTNESSTYSTSSSGEMHLFAQRQSQNGNLELDADGRVKAYVDFSEWHEAIDSMSEEQKESLYKELMPKSVYDPIHEHEEPAAEH